MSVDLSVSSGKRVGKNYEVNIQAVYDISAPYRRRCMTTDGQTQSSFDPSHGIGRVITPDTQWGFPVGIYCHNVWYGETGMVGLSDGEKM